MTPTEISAAYAALQDEYPELATDDISDAACFLACLKACAERGVHVAHQGTTSVALLTPEGYYMDLPAFHPHTITQVMDRVMQLPKVTA